MVIKINTYTDESGQDTNWQEFVVCTIICLNEDAESIENKLELVEKNSNKHNKWYKSNNKRRQNYVEHLLTEKILQKSTIYFSKFHNKADYVSLIASHIIKAIKSYSNDLDIDAKIFIDKIDKKTLDKIKSEIKLYKIKNSKIRGLNDKNNSIIRLADSICGMIRDLNNQKSSDVYSKLFKKIHEI